jgi:hypothetical protein
VAITSRGEGLHCEHAARRAIVGRGDIYPQIQELVFVRRRTVTVTDKAVGGVQSPAHGVPQSGIGEKRMVKSTVRINRSECQIGGNVFVLISKAYIALGQAGKSDLADEMQAKIDDKAESPSDVLRIVKEYVTLV